MLHRKGNRKIKGESDGKDNGKKEKHGRKAEMKKEWVSEAERRVRYETQIESWPGEVEKPQKKIKKSRILLKEPWMGRAVNTS